MVVLVPVGFLGAKGVVRKGPRVRQALAAWPPPSLPTGVSLGPGLRGPHALLSFFFPKEVSDSLSVHRRDVI